MAAFHLVRLMLLVSVASLASGDGDIQLSVHPIYSYWSCTVPGIDELFLNEPDCMNVCLAGYCQSKSFVPTFNMYAANSYNLSYPLFVGQTITITVNSTAVSISKDPGLPIGMQASGSGPIDLIWTPRSFAAGYIHTAGIYFPNLDRTVYLNISVASSVVSWQSPVNDTMEYEVLLGTSQQVQFTCNSNYPTSITLVSLTSHPYPEQNSPSLNDTSVIELHPDMNYPRILPDGTLDLYPPSSKMLAFYARRGLEGQTLVACLKCTSAPIEASSTRCVVFRVPLCKYVARTGDTFLAISRAYLGSLNWRRLWNMNSFISPDPNLFIQDAQVIHLGVNYTVKTGDTLLNVAIKFRTTILNLMEVNPYIADMNALEVGYDLCIPACTNRNYLPILPTIAL